ncbi:MAG: ATP-dependent helicase HrpB, partial [Gemmatimonadales bacterium]|nr:ATP-dependent helicase HrpB [Gemmatimonadales bacterium]
HCAAAIPQQKPPRLSGPREAADPAAAGAVLALAYPDRIAQLRPGQPGRFLLRNGRGAMLLPGQTLAREPFLVVASLDDAGAEGRILVAAPLAETELARVAEGHVVEEEVVEWRSVLRAVTARRVSRLGALILADRSLGTPDPERALRAALAGIRKDGLAVLPWSDAANTFRARVRFLHRVDPSWPDVSDEALLATLEGWLGPHLYGRWRRSELERLDLAPILGALIPRNRRNDLDREAPERITVPSGSQIVVNYADPAGPVLAVRLQELFGQRESPRIAGGRVPLTLHLLSPAYRPVQVTQDLAGFWATAYFEVRKELRGRYPKHHWPENPLEAEAVRGPKRRRP